MSTQDARMREFDAELRADFEAQGKIRDALVTAKKQAKERPEGLLWRIICAVSSQIEEDRKVILELGGPDVLTASAEEIRAFKASDVATAQWFRYYVGRYHVWRLCLSIIWRGLEDPALKGAYCAKAICEGCIKAVEELLPWNDLQAIAGVRRQVPEHSVAARNLEKETRKLLTGNLATRISLRRNVRLKSAIDEAREHSTEKSASAERFGQLLRDLYVEVPAAWEMPEDEVTRLHLPKLRTDVTHRLEQRARPLSEVQELAQWADHEKLIKQARDAGCSRQELEYAPFLFAGMKPKDIAKHMGITPGHARQLKLRIIRKLAS